MKCIFLVGPVLSMLGAAKEGFTTQKFGQKMLLKVTFFKKLTSHEGMILDFGSVSKTCTGFCIKSKNAFISAKDECFFLWQSTSF